MNLTHRKKICANIEFENKIKKPFLVLLVLKYNFIPR